MAPACFLSGLLLSKHHNATGEQAHRRKTDSDSFPSRRVMRKTIRDDSAHDPRDKTDDQHGHGTNTFMNGAPKYRPLSRHQTIDEVV